MKNMIAAWQHQHIHGMAAARSIAAAKINSEASAAAAISAWRVSNGGENIEKRSISAK